MAALHPLSICSLERITPDSVALGFEVPEALKPEFRFNPGQYLTLESEIEGEPVRRSYSICSLPEETLKVGVKRVEGGKFSTFANRDLKVGDSVLVMPPMGRFVVQEAATPQHHVALAAGSGITPILSIVGHVLEHRPLDRCTVIYGNRTLSSAMFLESLHRLKDRHMDRLSLVHVLSREALDTPLLQGRMDKEKLGLFIERSLLPSAASAYYLCGPGAMIDDAEAVLGEAGVDASRIHFERFTATHPTTKKDSPTAEGQSAKHVSVTVQLDGITRTFSMPKQGSVIEAAQQAGIEVPWSCSGGMCSTCRCKLVEGTAEMAVNYALEPWELEKGFVLACQLQPSGAALHLDFDDQ